MGRFAARMLRAALLERSVYEEVEADSGAGAQALAVVVLAAVAMGIGSVRNSGASGILWHTTVAVVGWYVWAYVTYLIGARLLPTRATAADHGQLLRTIGFSSAPGVLRVLMLVPAIALPVFVVCTLWMGAAMVVAVRQALDYDSTLRAVAVCAIGFPVYALALVTSILVLGPWPS
jgi:hypothetical protein